MGRYLRIYDSPFNLFHWRAIGAPTKWAKNWKNLEKIGNLLWVKKFLSKSGNIIGLLYANLGRRSRKSLPPSYENAPENSFIYLESPKKIIVYTFEKSAFYLSYIPKILFQIRIPRPQKPYSRTWNEYLMYFLWWAIWFSMLKNPYFILDGHVADHPLLKWEGKIEPSIARLWDLHG